LNSADTVHYNRDKIVIEEIMLMKKFSYNADIKTMLKLTRVAKKVFLCIFTKEGEGQF
jgi:hypothetical protein